MSAFIQVFNLLREQMIILIDSALGTLVSPQISLIADVILWFCWLWLIYHIIFKPVLWVMSSILSLFKFDFFDEIEKGEK